MDLGKAWQNCTVGQDKVATLKCIPDVFHNLVTAALVFAGVVAVIFIIVAGYKYLTSGGDAKKLEGAQKTLTFAIIGLFLIVFSFFIINLISYITGVSCIKQFSIGKCDKFQDGGGGNRPPKPKKDCPRKNQSWEWNPGFNRWECKS